MGVSFDSTAPDRTQESEPLQVRARQGSSHITESSQAGFQPESRSPPGSRSTLIRVIEGEIIPRLFLAHRDRALRKIAVSDACSAELSDDNENFVKLFLCGDAAEIVRRLQVFKARGIRRDKMYSDVLSPVSRVLAALWEEGRCSFEEMANGLACIDRVLNEIDSDTAADG